MEAIFSPQWRELSLWGKVEIFIFGLQAGQKMASKQYLSVVAGFTQGENGGKCREGENEV